MFELFFNATYLLVNAIAPPIQVMVDQHGWQSGNLHEAMEVRFISSNYIWTKDANNCVYTGVSVPYARDWADDRPQVEQDNGGTWLPDPDKIFGYAFVVNHKTCKDGTSEQVAFTGETYSRYITDGYTIDIRDVTKTPADLQPKWLPQVLKVIAENKPIAELTKTRVPADPTKVLKATVVAEAPAKADAATDPAKAATVADVPAKADVTAQVADQPAAPPAQ